MTGRPWDTGLQAERTSLAWRRTALALSTGGLAGMGAAVRIQHAGLAVPFALAALTGGLLLALDRYGYRRAQSALHAGRGPARADGPLIAWIGALAIAAGGAMLIFFR